MTRARDFDALEMAVDAAVAVEDVSFRRSMLVECLRQATVFAHDASIDDAGRVRCTRVGLRIQWLLGATR